MADAFRALWQRLTGKDRQRVKSAEEALLAALRASETQAGKLEQAGQTESAKAGEDGEFSIKRTSKMTLQAQLRMYDNGSIKSSDSFYFGETPAYCSDLGFNQLPLAMTQSDFKKSTKSKHDIRRSSIKTLSTKLADPILAFYDGETAAIVIDDVDRYGKPVVVALRKDVVMDRATVNGIQSIFGLEHQEQWFQNQQSEGKGLKVYNKEKASAIFQTYGSKRLGGNQDSLSADTLPQSSGEVNSNFSLKGSEALAAEVAQVTAQADQEGWSAEELQEEVQAAVHRVFEDLKKEYGSIEPGEKPAREVQVPKRTEKGKKVSQTVRTILEAGATPEEAIPTIEELTVKGEFSYTAYSDKAAIERAELTIQQRLPLTLQMAVVAIS